jgi:hypothetical protein
MSQACQNRVAIPTGVLMFKDVRFSASRRALLGAAGACIVQKMVRPATAFGQTAAGLKIKIGIIGAGHIGGTIRSSFRHVIQKN